MRTFALRAAASLAAITAISGLTGSPAMACQGIQFESSLIFLSDNMVDEVPDGLTQYRIQIPGHALRNVYDRSVLKVNLRDLETGERLEEDAPVKKLVIEIPMGTSCDNAIIPEAGEYFVIGSLARAEAGGPVLIHGHALFYPHVTRRKTTDMIFEGEAETE